MTRWYRHTRLEEIFDEDLNSLGPVRVYCIDGFFATDGGAWVKWVEPTWLRDLGGEVMECEKCRPAEKAS